MNKTGTQKIKGVGPPPLSMGPFGALPTFAKLEPKLHANAAAATIKLQSKTNAPVLPANPLARPAKAGYALLNGRQSA